MSEAILNSGASNLDLGEILLRTTELTEEQLEGARHEQSESGGRLTDRSVRRLLQRRLIQADMATRLKTVSSTICDKE